MSLISGVIEFHSHAIIIESSSSYTSKWGSPGFGPVPIRWLIFPFPFTYKANKLRPFKVIFSIQPIRNLNILQFPRLLRSNNLLRLCCSSPLCNLQHLSRKKPDVKYFVLPSEIRAKQSRERSKKSSYEGHKKMAMKARMMPRF